jgi:RHS repeat-associated protein
VYDDNDRLLTETFSQINGNTVITTYSHDNNGNTISKEVGDQQTVYVWDDENRLVAVDVSTATSIKYLKYQYDTSGIRVASIADGQETRYIVDANQPYAQVLEEYANNDTLLTSYIYGNDLISQTHYDSQTYVDSTTYYHVDALGSTTVLTDESGNVVNSYRYDAYGETIDETVTINNKYLFAGEQFDENLGDYYLRARYYDTSMGRFTRRDTYEGSLAEPLSLHKYIYANSNPVSRIDPSGLLSIDIASVTSTLQGYTALQGINMGINLASYGIDIATGNAAGLATNVIVDVGALLLGPGVATGNNVQKGAIVLGKFFSRGKQFKLGVASDSTVLAHNLTEFGFKNIPGGAAHHIVPGGESYGAA